MTGAAAPEAPATVLLDAPPAPPTSAGRPPVAGPTIGDVRAAVAEVARFPGFVVTVEVIDAGGVRVVEGAPSEVHERLDALDATVVSMRSRLGDGHRPGWHHG